MCKTMKPHSEFYTLSDGRPRNPCKECKKGAPRQQDPEDTRRYQLWHLYKITPQQFNRMLAEQEGRCAICLTDKPGLSNFAVDHDHRCCSGRRSCGQCVRGLLCLKCNMSLGWVERNSEGLKNYQERYEASPTS